MEDWGKVCCFPDKAVNFLWDQDTMLSYKQGLSEGKLKKASEYAESCSWVSFVKISLTKLQMAVYQATYNGLAFRVPILNTWFREKQPDKTAHISSHDYKLWGGLHLT